MTGSTVIGSFSWCSVKVIIASEEGVLSLLLSLDVRKYEDPDDMPNCFSKRYANRLQNAQYFQNPSKMASCNVTGLLRVLSLCLRPAHEDCLSTVVLFSLHLHLEDYLST